MAERLQRLPIMRAWPRRFWIAVLWGAIATLVMALATGLVAVVGREAWVEPMPLVLAARLIGHLANAPAESPAVAVAAFVVSVGYGALAAGLLAITSMNVTLGKGVVLGGGLWLVMLVFWLPMTGETAFALVTNPWFWATSAAIHVIYGGAVGGLVERHEHHDEAELAVLYSE